MLKGNESADSSGLSLDIVYLCLAVTVGPSLNMAYNWLDWLGNKKPLATFPPVLGI